MGELLRRIGSQLLLVGWSVALASSCAPADGRPQLTPTVRPQPPGSGDLRVTSFLAGLGDDANPTPYTAGYTIRRPETSGAQRVIVAHRDGETVVRFGEVAVFDGPSPATCRTAAGSCLEGVLDERVAGVGWDFSTTGAVRRIHSAAERATGPAVGQPRTIAGVDVACITVPLPAATTALFCRTDDGVLAHLDDGVVTIELDGLVRRVDPAAFVRPGG